MRCAAPCLRHVVPLMLILNLVAEATAYVHALNQPTEPLPCR